MRKFVMLCLAALVLTSSMLVGQTRSPRLTGKVLDSSGAVMPGTDVKVTQGDKTISETKTDANGLFGMDLAAGEYKVEVSAPDFKSFEQAVRVTPNMAPLSVTLTLAVLDVKVEVTTQNTEVSIDSESTLTTNTLTGDAIKELPDEEETLLNYLQQLAQASGAQGAANLIVDGIGGGKVPTKDQIQQIIINTNTFSALNNGGATIEIITRPGSAKWTGQVNFGFQDSALEAKNAYEATKPHKSQHVVQTSVSGTLIPGRLNASFNVRTLKQESEGNSLRAVTPTGLVSEGVISPTINRQFGMNGQLYVNKINTLNFSVNAQNTRQENSGVGGFTLPERATNRKGRNWQMQMSNRSIFSPTFIHEMRFRIVRNNNSTDPVTEAIAINVLDAFNSGGAQNRSDTRNTNLNWGNNLRYQLNPKWNLQAITEFTYTKVRNFSESNYLGAFTFSSLADFIAERPVQFRRTSGNPLVEVRQLDYSTGLQASWRLNPKASLDLGLRYQAQTNLRDYNNLAPTVQLSYGPRQGTVIRIGVRQTFNNFGIGNTEQLLRQDGKTRQTEIVILNPDFHDPLGGVNTATGSSSGSIRVRDSKLQAPQNWNTQLSVDHNLTPTWRVGVSASATKNSHNIRSRNINAPYPGTALPEELLARLRSFNTATQTAARLEVDRMRPLYPYVGNVYQYEATGNALSKNLNFRLLPPSNLSFFNKKIGIQGQVSYSINWRDDDQSTVNQYDWSEWARSGNRHSVSGSMNVRLPKGYNINLNPNWNSGSFYSITTGRDENGDQSTNDRPVGLPRNSAVGPSTYNVDLNLNKTFNLKRASAPAARPANFAPPGQILTQGPGGGQIVLPANASPQLQEAIARGQVQLQGGNIPQQPQVPYTGPRLSLSINVRNLLNNTQLYGYSGVLTSPFFGRATTAAPARAVRGSLTLSWQ